MTHPLADHAEPSPAYCTFLLRLKPTCSPSETPRASLSGDDCAGVHVPAWARACMCAGARACVAVLGRMGVLRQHVFDHMHRERALLSLDSIKVRVDFFRSTTGSDPDPEADQKFGYLDLGLPIASSKRVDLHRQLQDAYRPGTTAVLCVQLWSLVPVSDC